MNVVNRSALRSGFLITLNIANSNLLAEVITRESLTQFFEVKYAHRINESSSANRLRNHVVFSYISATRYGSELIPEIIDSASSWPLLKPSSINRIISQLENSSLGTQ